MPILNVLLPRKTTAIYTKMWRMIRGVFPTLHPTSFSADYELAAIQALQGSFDRPLNFLGCLFHYKKSIDDQCKQKGGSSAIKQTGGYVQVDE